MKKALLIVAALGLVLVAQASFGGPLLTAVTGAATIGDGSAPIEPRRSYYGPRLA